MKNIYNIICGLILICLANSLYATPKFNNSDQIIDTITTNNDIDHTDLDQNSKSESNNNFESENQTLNVADPVANMLLQAVSLMGIPYKWGGNTPQTGMDCSGFVRYLFKSSLGINLPRTAREMAQVGKKIPLNQLQAGDLLFFNTIAHRANSHMGMYIGDNKFIQSPKTGSQIQISDFSGYWRSHFNGAKRMVEEYNQESGIINLKSLEYLHNQALNNFVRKKTKFLHHGRSLKKNLTNKKILKQHMTTKMKIKIKKHKVRIKK